MGLRAASRWLELRRRPGIGRLVAAEVPPGPVPVRQACHGITLGSCESELLRRVDPGRRTLGRSFQEELATPLGLDFYFRLPAEIPDSRLAPLYRPGMAAMLVTIPLALSLAGRALHRSIGEPDPSRA